MIFAFRKARGRWNPPKRVHLPGPYRIIRCLICLSCLFARTAHGQDAAQSAIQGRVTTRMGAPLPGVELTALRDSISVTTDSGGRFVLRARPGDLVIRVRRIGYLPQYLSASLRSGETREVTIAMTAGAYQLPEVEVNVTAFKPVEYAYTSKYDEFFRRKHVGLGHYISRADIDRFGRTETPELLMGIPGVYILLGAPGRTHSSVRIRTCEQVSVWVDGVQLNPPGMRQPRRAWLFGRADEAQENIGQRTGEMLERVLPAQIEMIEVYTGPAQMPAEAVGNSCAAIMIWTR